MTKQRRVLTVATVSFLAIVAVAAFADPPADPVGACCRGASVAVVVDVTDAECRRLANGKVYKWVKGDFDPTDNKSPCIEGSID